MKNLHKFTTQTECNSAKLKTPNLCFVEENRNVFSNITNDYVDLGLPSGIKWAKCNIGAENETDYGLYFQVGATVGYTDSEVKPHSYWSTLPGNLGAPTGQYSYLLNWNKANTTNGVLNTSVDAAYANTNGGAKIPTVTDINELVDNTNISWTTINNVTGRKFTNKKDSSKYIFIPASGYGYNSDPHSGGNTYIMSSSTYSNPKGWYFFSFNESSCSKISEWMDRPYAVCVRGIKA